jgi:hypothetical protein
MMKNTFNFFYVFQINLYKNKKLLMFTFLFIIRLIKNGSVSNYNNFKNRLLSILQEFQ